MFDFIRRIRWTGYYRKPDYYGWTYAGKRFNCYNVRISDSRTHAFIKWRWLKLLET